MFGYTIQLPKYEINKASSILNKLSYKQEFTHLEFIPNDFQCTYHLYSFEDGL